MLLLNDKFDTFFSTNILLDDKREKDVNRFRPRKLINSSYFLKEHANTSLKITAQQLLLHLCCYVNVPEVHVEVDTFSIL